MGEPELKGMTFAGLSGDIRKKIGQGTFSSQAREDSSKVSVGGLIDWRTLLPASGFRRTHPRAGPNKCEEGRYSRGANSRI